MKTRQLILSDLQRYGKSFLYSYCSIPGFKYTVWMRITKGLRRRFLYKPFFLFSALILRHYSSKYGIMIPYATEIGAGFYIGHFGTIVISPMAIIGKNCNISQGVTVGQTNRGNRLGVPTIGDNVYIGPGAKIIGNIKIGDNVAIGANAVVTKDLPDNAVAVGIPAKIISYKGSAEYISRKI